MIVRAGDSRSIAAGAAVDWAPTRLFSNRSVVRKGDWSKVRPVPCGLVRDRCAGSLYRYTMCKPTNQLPLLGRRLRLLDSPAPAGVDQARLAASDASASTETPFVCLPSQQRWPFRIVGSPGLALRRGNKGNVRGAARLDRIHLRRRLPFPHTHGYIADHKPETLRATPVAGTLRGRPPGRPWVQGSDPIGRAHV